MYGQENYLRISQLIDERRKGAIALADARNAQVRAQSEDIRDIDAELTKTGLLIFKTACDGEDITPIRARNEALMKDRCRILASLGYPEDYTEPHFTCTKCSDTGYVGTRMCSCFRELLLKENIKTSGIGNLIEKQTFENFSLDIYGEDRIFMEPVLTIAKAYAEGFCNESRNLLLIGKTGTGKTHISTAIAKVVIENGYNVIYDSVQNIINAFEQDKFHSGWGHGEPKSNKYLECDLLIIDDLGTEFITQFTISCLYNLVNTRMNKSLPIVFSTNLTKDQLQGQYDDRLFSRIYGSSQALQFYGLDNRLN